MTLPIYMLRWRPDRQETTAVSLDKRSTVNTKHTRPEQRSVFQHYGEATPCLRPTALDGIVKRMKALRREDESAGMKLLNVNVGTRQSIEGGNAARDTGIYKKPVQGVVAIARDGIVGDAICNSKHHGGPDQAVYVYGEPDYEWWATHLGRTVEFGTFGENLTISGLESAHACIGDRFLIRSAVLEVTAPRVPCGTLAQRMGDPSFVKQFRAAERPGLYCRVIREGSVQAGGTVTHERCSRDAITALELFRDFYNTQRDEADLRRHLAAPISIRARIEKERQLAQLLGQRATT